MGKPFLGNVLGNALRNLSIILDLSPISIKLLVICYLNPILNKHPKFWKFFYIEVSPYGAEHMLPVIEYALAFWKH
jgi:hypothetical protein